LRIVLHDYAGHPFQAQLSRNLARRGHQVWHLSSADTQTPKGRLEVDPELADRLTNISLSSGKVIRKDTFFERKAQEEHFGKLVGGEIARIRPDVVLSGNAPLETQRGVLKATRAADAAFIFWVQDIHGEAIYRILSQKFGVLGRLVGRYYQALEYSMLKKSDKVIVISNDFLPVLTAQGVVRDRISVIENWATLDEIDYRPPSEPAEDAPVRFIYSGTLGYKHNPELLLAVTGLPGVTVNIYSEGRVAEDLKKTAPATPNLRVEPWVPFDQLSAMLASADVLMAIIESDAGVFSVPSKILTYLCAGRPILASIPAENLAARTLLNAGAGLVSLPGDTAAFVENAQRLASDPALRRDMGLRGRAYAEKAFDIAAIGDQFEALIEEVARAYRT
jgi:colanic acid biosynthesis glycosyl transferase WcaI